MLDWDLMELSVFQLFQAKTELLSTSAHWEKERTEGKDVA